jgi:hypothetical protein
VEEFDQSFERDADPDDLDDKIRVLTAHIDRGKERRRQLVRSFRSQGTPQDLLWGVFDAHQHEDGKRHASTRLMKLVFARPESAPDARPAHLWPLDDPRVQDSKLSGSAIHGMSSLSSAGISFINWMESHFLHDRNSLGRIIHKLDEKSHPESHSSHREAEHLRSPTVGLAHFQKSSTERSLIWQSRLEN